MANPQGDVNFSRLSNELLERIIMSNFTKLQYSILLLVWRLSWGCKGKKTAYIPNLTTFEICGANIRIARNELEKLQKANVLEIDGCYYSIQKDYDKWHIGLTDGFDEELMKNLIRSNLGEENTSENRNSGLPKIGTRHFRKSEVISENTSENRNSGLPKIGTPTLEKPDNHKEISPPKDIIKKRGLKKDVGSADGGFSKVHSSPKKKSISDPRIKEIFSYYEEGFLSRFHKKPLVNYPKDGAILKNLFVLLDQENPALSTQEMKKSLDNYLGSSDDFIINGGYSIGIFKIKFNAMRIRGSHKVQLGKNELGEEKDKYDYSKLFDHD